MDVVDIFSPRTIPAVQLGVVTGSGSASAGGHEYARAPRLAGRVPVGGSAVTIRVGNGRAVIGAGGYYSPQTDQGE